MTRLIVATAVVLAVALPAAASPLESLREWWFGQPWEFIQATGGIRVGDATRLADGTVSIVLECDVAGVRPTTRQPEAQNSGLGVAKILTGAEDFTLVISIRTHVGGSSSCPTARFQTIKPGNYRVFYRGADRELHEVGQVSVP